MTQAVQHEWVELTIPHRTGGAVNLADKIINAVRANPMTLPSIIDTINAAADVEWPEEFLSNQVRLLEWRGNIVKKGDQYSVPESPAEGAQS
jgi:hypothetical protein